MSRAQKWEVFREYYPLANNIEVTCWGTVIVDCAETESVTPRLIIVLFIYFCFDTFYTIEAIGVAVFR